MRRVLIQNTGLAQAGPLGTRWLGRRRSALAPVCSSDVHRRACGSRDGAPLNARSGRKWLQWRTGCHGGSSPSPGTGNRTRTKNPKAQRDGCLYEKLNSTIMVVKATDDGRRCDAALMLNGTRNRSVLAKRQMSPQLVVVGSILRQDPA
jgi:hypothetical protein